jgi:hypothetical protein
MSTRLCSFIPIIGKVQPSTIPFSPKDALRPFPFHPFFSCLILFLNLYATQQKETSYQIKCYRTIFNTAIAVHFPNKVIIRGPVHFGVNLNINFPLAVPQQPLGKKTGAGPDISHSKAF